MVTLQYLERELENGDLIVTVNLPELNLQCEQTVTVTNLISLEDLPQIVYERKEELSNILFERLVVNIDAERKLTMAFDDMIEPISEELKE